MRHLKATLVIALIASLVPAAAYAHWASTRWGMSVEEVIAAYPGASHKERREEQDLHGMHFLAQAPYRDGDTDTTVEFYFDPAGAGLGLVSLRVDDAGQCDSYRETLIARRGPGRVYYPATGPKKERSTVWTDPETHDRYVFYEMLLDEKIPIICKFVIHPMDAD
jgi:hypothetical protein